MRVPRSDHPAPPHRRVLFEPDAVSDHALSEDEEMDAVDRASADSFPASDPPSSSSPAA